MCWGGSPRPDPGSQIGCCCSTEHSTKGGLGAALLPIGSDWLVEADCHALSYCAPRECAAGVARASLCIVYVREACGRRQSTVGRRRAAEAELHPPSSPACSAPRPQRMPLLQSWVKCAVRVVCGPSCLVRGGAAVAQCAARRLLSAEKLAYCLLFAVCHDPVT